MTFSTDSDNAMLQQLVDGEVAHVYSYEEALDHGISAELFPVRDQVPPRVPEEMWVVGVVRILRETERVTIEWRWIR